MRPRLPLVALAAAAALTAGCGINDPYQPGATTTATPRAAHEDEPYLSLAQRDAQRQVERTVRAFLAGYLPYSYGQATARGIRAATPALQRELAAHPPRVSAAARQAVRPRVRQQRVSGLNGRRAYVLAQVGDGSRSYPTSLTLERPGRRWLVATVG
jgi:DNA-binding NarL/FixJ family response regulator